MATKIFTFSSVKDELNFKELKKEQWDVSMFGNYYPDIQGLAVEMKLRVTSQNIKDSRTIY